jgi:hypothetical protein
VLSLKLVRVSVPQYKVRGDMALLECQYELGHNKLYSVKWYKDNEEFYRYLPGSDTIKQSYKVDGVRVEVSGYSFLICSYTEVTLTPSSYI